MGWCEDGKDWLQDLSRCYEGGGDQDGEALKRNACVAATSATTKTATAMTTSQTTSAQAIERKWVCYEKRS